MTPEENNGFTKREMTKMYIGYISERIKTLEKREVYLIGIIIALACALAGKEIGVI